MKVILVILLILSLVLLGYFYKKSTRVTQLNLDIQVQNKELEKLNAQLKDDEELLRDGISVAKSKLKYFEDQISSAHSNLQKLEETRKTMMENANQQAEQYLQDRISAMNDKFEQEEREAKKQITLRLLALDGEIKENEQRLQDLQSKQQAYLEAQKREIEMQEKKDYYRLVLNPSDLQDVALLKSLQTKLNKIDTIDKVIYEIYYRPAYNVLMAHLSSKTDKICGIYKITNIKTGQAYIGQSVDVKERIRQHIKNALSSNGPTNKLYQQMKNDGPEDFTFEILEEVPRSQLNEREVYWIEFYQTKDWGLNSTRGGS